MTACMHGVVQGLLVWIEQCRVAVMDDRFGKGVTFSCRALTFNEGTDGKGKGAHRRPWNEGAALTRWCFEKVAGRL